MNVKVEKQDKSKVVIEFTISAEEFKQSLEKSFAKHANQFKVPGFRNGKVPMSMVEKIYGEGVLFNSAIEDRVDDDFRNAVIENNLEVVSKPELDIKQIGKDKECIYTVQFFVKPEAKVKEYKGLEVPKITIEITDEDVENEINQVREKNARVITVDNRALKNGDISTIDFEGFVDSVAFEGGKGNDFELTIGSHQFIPGFEEQLVGMEIGETREIIVTFPEEYHSDNLAGKNAMFRVTLKGIKEKELPALDDEFAKDVSEFDNLSDYKNSVKEKVLNHKEEHAKADKEQSVIAKLIDNVEAEIPEAMIDSQVEESFEQFAHNLSHQGFTIEQYAKMLNTTADEIKNQFRPSAERDVKLKLAVEYIGKNETIEVSEDEVNEKIEELAKQYGSENSESLKINPNVRHYMEERLKQDKIMALVLDSAVEK